LKHPIYCSSPVMQSNPWCQGENTCDCQAYCAASTPSNWQIDPHCCGCEGVALLQAQVVDPNETDSDKRLKHPVYCENPAMQTNPWCQGENSCDCQSYCSASLPSNWKLDPHCCGCEGAALLQASEEAPAEGKRSEYCQYLPENMNLPWCKSAEGCRCQSFCTTSVAPSAWSWDPNCCGCSETALLQVDSGSMAHPLYCRAPQAVFSPWCQGENTCSCQAYCTMAVPPANWGWDPNCCLCDGSAGVASPAPGPSPAPLPSPTPGPAPSAGESSATGGLTHPLYCQQSALGMYSPYCMGPNTCSCAGYCKVTVLPTMWGYDPNCCACTGEGASAPAPTPYSGPRKHPVYCRDLTASGISSPWCAGESTCKCQPYCSSSSPASWGWDPQCCACGEDTTEAPTESSETPTEGSASIGPPLPTAEGGALEHPSYCANVPPGTLLPWCTGPASCKCELYCKASVMPANWGVDPNCCGCSSEGAAEEEPSPATAPNASAPVTYGPLTHPKYCDSLPKGAPALAWCEGENTCACQDYCTLSVAPSNWGWDPNCCACSSAEIEQQSKAMDDEVAMEAAGMAADVGGGSGSAPVSLAVVKRLRLPAYCAYIGEAAKPEACKTGTGGCTCDAFCKQYVPQQSWKYNPQCCGCQ